MCVTAFYFNPTPSDDDGFRLIVAFNRDEMYHRPTKPSQFWDDIPDILSGIDMAAGKEGGTWLGASKRGRLAFILNIDYNPHGVMKGAKARGALVSNFLAGEESGEDYLQEIAQEGDEYNGFNLITVDIGKGEAHYYCNKTSTPPQRLEPGIYGISNSPLDRPWRKAEHIKDILSGILKNNNAMDAESLVEILHHELQRTELLNGEKFTYKPGETVSISELSNTLPQMVNVRAPGLGTRSSTVIVMDKAGKVLYSERSMDDPINEEHPQWTFRNHTFNLTCTL